LTVWQVRGHAAAAVERRPQVLRIHAPHQFKVMRRDRPGSVVDRRAADREQLALPKPAQVGMRLNHLASRCAAQ